MKWKLYIYFYIKDPSEDAILVEGTEEYCNDLEVDPTDVIMLIIAYHLDSENMCEFTRENWIKGWTSLGYLNFLLFFFFFFFIIYFRIIYFYINFEFYVSYYFLILY